MKKPFYIGAVVGVVLVMIMSTVIRLPFSAPFDKRCSESTVYGDISELSFLKPYETEKLDRLLPDGAHDSYCVAVSYKGKSFTVVAFVFDSDERARRYMFDVTDERLPVPNAEYNAGYDMAEDEAFVEAEHGGNYYRVTGDCSEEFIRFMQLMFSNMSVQVKEGLSDGTL